MIAAHEDPLDLAWRESRLPDGDPDVRRLVDEADAGDPDDRRRLVEQLTGPIGEPAGWVLPVHAEHDGWATSDWPTRRGRLFLIPGDSPIGLRLPLGSLGWSDFPGVPERSAFEPPTLLAPPGTPPPDKGRVSAPGQLPPTALAFELRNGHVGVFLPPIEHAERAVEMLTVVEDVAAELDLPVVLEGYPLPRGPSLRDAGRHARPRGDRGQHPSVVELGRAARHRRDAVRRGSLGAAPHREVRPRRHPHRHRWRQPRHPRRTDAGRQSAAPSTRSAAEPRDLLAAPSVAVLSVLRPVHRAHQPGAARGRGPRRHAVRARARLRRTRSAGRPGAPVGGRSGPAQPARRSHRQHAPVGVLHRQAVLARQRARTTRTARTARVRDAAPSADGAGAVAARPIAGDAVLGGAVLGFARAMGHRPLRPLPAAALRAH